MVYILVSIHLRRTIIHRVHVIFFVKYWSFTDEELDFIINYYARISQIMTDKLDKETAYSTIRNIFNKKVLIVVGTGDVVGRERIPSI